MKRMLSQARKLALLVSGRCCCAGAAAILFVILLVLPASSQSLPAIACDSLAKLNLPHTTIESARQVAAGAFVPPEGAGGSMRHPAWNSNPEFCRIEATAKPSKDSEIKIEIWLPVKEWNGKYMGSASGGWAGSQSYGSILEALNRGFATASTDTGHVASKSVPNGSFIVGHPEKFVDYGYRAIHEMAVTAKLVIAAYYGVAPKYSMLVGCSLGGMETLQEAYRFPEDYNGIVVGAPANPMTLFNAAQMWPAWLIYKDPSRATPPEKFKMIHEAALKACAGPIGLKQGFIEEPDKCHFDPKVLLCKGADGPDCLTAGQVDLMQQIYTGPVNPRTHEAIFPGPPRGAELQLPMYTASTPHANATALYRYAVYQDANWDWKTMDYDSSIALARKRVDPLMRARDDLSPFFDHGGKMMIYIGWTDYHNPLELIDYYKRVQANDGEGKAADSLRLFVIPGMDHCFGGAGCDTFDKMGTIDRWMESGVAPEQMLGSKLVDGKVVRTAKLCAYPTVAKYLGSGDTEDAASFVCAKPE